MDGQTYVPTILVITKIGNVEWNGAWFMKCLALSYWRSVITNFNRDNRLTNEPPITLEEGCRGKDIEHTLGDIKILQTVLKS